MSKDKERERIINTELDLLYSNFNMEGIELTKEELKELRYLANDFEEIVQLVSGRLLKETDLEETDVEFIDAIQVAIYAYYNLLYIVDVYLYEGDFAGLANHTFEKVWGDISVKDKEMLITAYLRLEDLLMLVYGTYVLLGQVENK